MRNNFREVLNYLLYFYLSNIAKAIAILYSLLSSLGECKAITISAAIVDEVGRAMTYQYYFRRLYERVDVLYKKNIKDDKFYQTFKNYYHPDKRIILHRKLT